MHPFLVLQMCLYVWGMFEERGVGFGVSKIEEACLLASPALNFHSERIRAPRAVASSSACS